MRNFCRTYENHPAALSLAMELGWTQNVVIMEADLTMELREWYLRAARQFVWSKTELIARIAEQAHLEMILDDERKETETPQTERLIHRTESLRILPFTIQAFPYYTMLMRCRGSPA